MKIEDLQVVRFHEVCVTFLEGKCANNRQRVSDNHLRLETFEIMQILLNSITFMF